MIVKDWDHKIIDAALAASAFIKESNYNILYNERNTINSFYNIIEAEDADLILDYTESTLNGLAIVQRTNEFHSEYFGYLNKFYVLPDRRSTRAAFRLMQECVDWFDTMQCKYVFTSATGGINRDKAFIKLCLKYGFTQDDSGILIRKSK